MHRFYLFGLFLAAALLWPASMQAKAPLDKTPEYNKLLETAQQQGQVRIIVRLTTPFQPEGNLLQAQAGGQRAAIAQDQAGLLNRLVGHTISVNREKIEITQLRREAWIAFFR